MKKHVYNLKQMFYGVATEIGFMCILITAFFILIWLLMR